MNPDKVNRRRVLTLTDLPNVGKATAGDLELLGIHRPSELVGCDPYVLYDRLCEATGVRQDPCVIDVFVSITHFMNGGKAKPWWHFTDQRKRELERRTRR